MIDIYNRTILQGRETDDASLGIVQSENTADTAGTATCQESPTPGEQHRDTSDGYEQEASPQGAFDETQSAASQSQVSDGDSQQQAETSLLDLETNTQLALDFLKSSIKAGEYLLNIRDNHLFVKLMNKKTGKAYTWDEYCHDFLGVTRQYADRKINAWKTRAEMEPKFEKELFELLPVTTDFWVQLGNVPEVERESVLKQLIGQFQASGKTLRSLKAKDIKKHLESADEEDESSDVDAESEECDEQETPMTPEQLIEDLKSGKRTDFKDVPVEIREALRLKLQEGLADIENLKVIFENALQNLDSLDDDTKMVSVSKDDEDDEQTPEKLVV